MEPMLAVEASVDQRYALRMNQLLAERDRMMRAKERREKIRQEKEEERKKKDKNKGKGKGGRSHGVSSAAPSRACGVPGTCRHAPRVSQEQSSSSEDEATGRRSGRDAKKGRKGKKKPPAKQINKMNLRHSK